MTQCTSLDYGSLRAPARHGADRDPHRACGARRLGANGPLGGLDARHQSPCLAFRQLRWLQRRFAPRGPRANARAPSFAACAPGVPGGPRELALSGALRRREPGCPRLRRGRGYAPHSWTERLGALCLPWLWSLPLPPPVSGSTAAPPRPSRCRAPAGSGWTPEPPQGGSPEMRGIVDDASSAKIERFVGSLNSVRTAL